MWYNGINIVHFFDIFVFIFISIIFLFNIKCWWIISLKILKSPKSLSEYNLLNINKTNEVTSDSGLAEDIKALKQLYDDGALTKEEFEKTKSLLLN